jgi:hypothetical protein
MCLGPSQIVGPGDNNNDFNWLQTSQEEYTSNKSATDTAVGETMLLEQFAIKHVPPVNYHFIFH